MRWPHRANLTPFTRGWPPPSKNWTRHYGTPDGLAVDAVKQKVLAALSHDEPQDLRTLAKKTPGISGKRVKGTVAALEDQVVREGKGVKGDPYTYRIAVDSIPSQANPIGEETNPAHIGNPEIEVAQGDLRS